FPAFAFFRGPGQGCECAGLAAGQRGRDGHRLRADGRRRTRLDHRDSAGRTGKKAFKDVTDALKDVPGVVITGGGSSSDISVRGMAPSYTMILIDGRRQNSRETRPNSDGPGIEQGWLPPMQAIERIEVIRGPMS